MLSAWGAPHEVEAFSIVPAAVTEVLPADLRATSKPKRPDASPAMLRALLAQAGLEQLVVRGPVTRMLSVDTPTEYWLRFALGSPNLKELLPTLDDEQRRALQSAVESRAAAAGCAGASGAVALPASAYFGSGVKPPQPL